MRSIKKWMWAVWVPLVMVPTSSFAEPDLASQVAAQINQSEVVLAHVSQVRTMKALKRPLVSEGQWVYSKKDGVFWLMEQPVRVLYWFGEQRVVEISPSGERRVQEVKNNPRLAHMGSIMKSMLGAQTGALRDLFHIQAKGTVNQWTLELVPRGEPLSQYLKSVNVMGGRFIDGLVLEERTGDVTHLTLKNSRALGAVPNDILESFKQP